MFNVTADELQQVTASLPKPDSTLKSKITVVMVNPDRELTFIKVVRVDGGEEPWHNEWALMHNPAPVQPPALSDEEFDSFADAMLDAEQQVMLNIAQTLLDDMEPNTMRTVANWCDERATALEAELDNLFPEVSIQVDSMFKNIFRSVAWGEEDEPEFDLFEAAKAIRKAAHVYNSAVITAREGGHVVVNASIPIEDHPSKTSGTIWVDDIKVEMPL